MSNNTTKVNNPMKVITGKDTRWSYANVWEAKSINGGAPKFSVSLIIPKSDTVTVQKIKAAIEAAYHEGEAKLKGNGKSVPALSVIKNPLRDGDTERPDDPAYAGCYFVNANSTTAPGIVDADRNPILVRSEVYSLPAVLTTFRRFVTVNPSVVRLRLNPTSTPMTMTIFWRKEG